MNKLLYEVAEEVFRLKNNGKKIISLNLGETNMPVPECGIEAAITHLKTSDAGYSFAAGLKELRQKIAERENCGIENVIVGTGSKEIIFGLMSMLLKKGDNIIIPEPTWPTYGLNAEHLGLEVKIIETSLDKKWSFDGLEFKDEKMLILCNPLNPTSTVYNENLLKKTIDDANDSGLTVILDEAYKALAFEKIPNYENAIRVRSFSKEFNMEGYRLGYAIAPKEIVNKMIDFNHMCIACVPEFVQKAGLACLENESEILKKHWDIWHTRMLFASKIMKKNGFEFSEPESGIYLFAKHRNIEDSRHFYRELLNEGVAIAPGLAFGNFKQFIRISINQKEEILEKAFAKMAAIVEK